MVTIQILADILKRVTDAYAFEATQFAIGCTRGATGLVDDFDDSESLQEYLEMWTLVTEARNTLEALNFGD